MKIGLLLIVMAALAGCQTQTSDDGLSGRITLWHSWTPAEADILDEALAEFQELHPEVRIIPVALPEDRILEEFQARQRERREAEAQEAIIELEEGIEGAEEGHQGQAQEEDALDPVDQGLEEGIAQGEALVVAPQHEGRHLQGEQAGDAVDDVEEAVQHDRLGTAVDAKHNGNDTDQQVAAGRYQ